MSIVLCLINYLGVLGQSSPIEEVNHAIEKANVSGISKYFDNAISLTLHNHQSIYSRSQAEMILREFFEKNMPTHFQMSHSGEEAHTRFVIGILSTSKGQFRLYYALKLKDEKYFFIEIRIEE